MLPRYREILRLFLVAPLCIVFMPAARAEGPSPCTTMPVVHGGIVPARDSRTVETLTVASLNINGQGRIADALTAWAMDKSVDVLLLQEVGHASTDGEAFVAALSRRLDQAFAYAPAALAENGHTQGLAILSRYPFVDVRVRPLDYFPLRIRSRCRIALAVTVETTGGAIHLVNVHLDTRINTKNRISQLAPALEAAQLFDGPRIIGGDFNTMNIRWFRAMWPFPYLQRQAAAVRALLSAAGFQTPFTASPPTFRFLGFPMKLDWLFISELEPLEWGVDRVRFTDHRAVWARVEPVRWDR